MHDSSVQEGTVAELLLLVCFLGIIHVNIIVGQLISSQAFSV